MSFGPTRDLTLGIKSLPWAAAVTLDPANCGQPDSSRPWCPTHPRRLKMTWFSLVTKHGVSQARLRKGKCWKLCHKETGPSVWTLLPQGGRGGWCPREGLPAAPSWPPAGRTGPVQGREGWSPGGQRGRWRRSVSVPLFSLQPGRWQHVLCDPLNKAALSVMQVSVFLASSPQPRKLFSRESPARAQQATVPSVSLLAALPCLQPCRWSLPL